MPHRRPPGLRADANARENFRQRYDELEAQRAALVARLLGIKRTCVGRCEMSLMIPKRTCELTQSHSCKSAPSSSAKRGDLFFFVRNFNGNGAAVGRNMMPVWVLL